MAIGIQPGASQLNSTLSSWAVQLRDLMTNINEFDTYVNSLGVSGLESVGLSAADAASFNTMVSYLSNVAGVYFGTIQQGGTGGTGAIQFNFHNALSVLWGGQ